MHKDAQAIDPKVSGQKAFITEMGDKERRRCITTLKDRINESKSPGQP
jgi:hypothetical protein